MTASSITRRRMLGATVAAAAAATLSSRSALGTSGPAHGARRVIIDTDPGVDDALALFLALHSPELKVEAVTAVAGNVPLEVTLPNALRLLEIAGRADIPVAAGAASPLERRLIDAAYFHGNNGLGGVRFPDAKTKPVSESATALLRRIIGKSPGEVALVAIGPLTNVALAFREDPGLAAKLHSLTIMGGSLSGGNITPAAEFNSYVDPEAADIVYRSGAKITMVGLDVTRKVSLGETQVRALESASGAAGRAAGRIMRSMLENPRAPGTKEPRTLVHDPMAVAALIDPTLFTFQDIQISVETRGELTAGETLGYRHGPTRASAPRREAKNMRASGEYKPNAAVALDIDGPRFLDFLMERLAR